MQDYQKELDLLRTEEKVCHDAIDATTNRWLIARGRRVLFEAGVQLGDVVETIAEL